MNVSLHLEWDENIRENISYLQIKVFKGDFLSCGHSYWKLMSWHYIYFVFQQSVHSFMSCDSVKHCFFFNLCLICFLFVLTHLLYWALMEQKMSILMQFHKKWNLNSQHIVTVTSKLNEDNDDQTSWNLNSSCRGIWTTLHNVA